MTSRSCCDMSPSVHGRDGELARVHLLGEPVHRSAGVDEDDGLGDGQCLVEIGGRVELRLLALDRDVVLLDAIEAQLPLFDKDPDGVAHEPLGNLEDVKRHCG